MRRVNSVISITALGFLVILAPFAPSDLLARERKGNSASDDCLTGEIQLGCDVKAKIDKIKKLESQAECYDRAKSKVDFLKCEAM
jgi:hypothetical protein